jgi:hypothetical protein
MDLTDEQKDYNIIFDSFINYQFNSKEFHKRMEMHYKKYGLPWDKIYYKSYSVDADYLQFVSTRSNDDLD